MTNLADNPALTIDPIPFWENPTKGLFHKAGLNRKRLLEQLNILAPDYTSLNTEAPSVPFTSGPLTGYEDEMFGYVVASINQKIGRDNNISPQLLSMFVDGYTRRILLAELSSEAKHTWLQNHFNTITLEDWDHLSMDVREALTEEFYPGGKKAWEGYLKNLFENGDLKDTIRREDINIHLLLPRNTSKSQQEAAERSKEERERAEKEADRTIEFIGKQLAKDDISMLRPYSDRRKELYEAIRLVSFALGSDKPMTWDAALKAEATRKAIVVECWSNVYASQATPGDILDCILAQKIHRECIDFDALREAVNASFPTEPVLTPDEAWSEFASH